MIQVIPQTRDEKIAMYLKLTKRELAEMLTAANEALAAVPQQQMWQTGVLMKTNPVEEDSLEQPSPFKIVETITTNNTGINPHPTIWNTP